MSQKVLEISSEETKYIDPYQIASIQLVDGTTIMVNNGEEQAQEEGFVEEKKDEQQYQSQEVQGQDGQKLRGRGLGAIAGAAAGAALLGTAAAVGGAMRRPYYGRYGYGYGYGYRPRPMYFGPRPMFW